MKFAPHASSLVLAALLLSPSALAEDGPYKSWQESSDDDVTVKIEDSFKRIERHDTRYDSRYESTTDTDVDLSYRTSEDNDVTQSHSEDNDIDLRFRASEDNDVVDSYNHDSNYSEDNDVTTSWRQRLDIDSVVATPTMDSRTDTRQDAGHNGYTDAYGSASGHEVGVYGGETSVSAGNDEQIFMGPAMVNTNTNILPSNDLFIGGHNSGPIGQSNTAAGRDLGDKGVFAPIGNTSAVVAGDVGQASTAITEQSGDARNSAEEVMSSRIGR